MFVSRMFPWARGVPFLPLFKTSCLLVNSENRNKIWVRIFEADLRDFPFTGLTRPPRCVTITALPERVDYDTDNPNLGPENSLSPSQAQTGTGSKTTECRRDINDGTTCTCNADFIYTRMDRAGIKLPSCLDVMSTSIST